MNGTRSWRSSEWLVISLVTLVGAVLRFWAFGHLSLDHFDEGIYAFAGLWITTDDGPLGLDPMVIPYAPFGFPILIGLSYVVFGISDLSAILVATVCGVASIPVVGWLARRTFGPGAGAAAATFAALAMAHVAFSRKALTDVPFLLAWLVAIGQGSRFLEKPGPARALSLGLTVGLAQCFKYNGWLVGVIVIVAALSGTISRRTDRVPGALLRTYGWGLASALAAGLVYAPWYRFVAANGGYAGLLRHQRGYLGGFSSWSAHWSTQLGEAYSLSGSRGWGALTWSIAWLLAGLTDGGGRPFASRGRFKTIGSLSALGFGAGLFALQANLPWWLGLAWTPWLLVAAVPSLRVVGAWWLVMSILTPFYHPYARLWLPLHGVGWILLGGVFVRYGPIVRVPAQASAERSEGPVVPGTGPVWGGVALLCALISLVQLGRTSPHPMPWSWVLRPSRTATLRHFAFLSLREASSAQPKVIRVLARRPVVFYIALMWRGPIQLESGLGRLLQPGEPESWAIIDGAILEQEGESEASLARLSTHWRPVTSAQVEVDPVTLLDVHPEAAFQEHPRRTFELWVLSPRIPPGAPLSFGPGQPSSKGPHAP